MCWGKRRNNIYTPCLHIIISVFDFHLILIFMFIVSIFCNWCGKGANSQPNYFWETKERVHSQLTCLKYHCWHNKLWHSTFSHKWHDYYVTIISPDLWSPGSEWLWPFVATCNEYQDLNCDGRVFGIRVRLETNPMAQQLWQSGTRAQDKWPSSESQHLDAKVICCSL